jgi:hypothetical protein
MKVIYVAGPYRAGTERGVLNNIRNAEAVAIEVWRAGFVALTPHLNTRLFGGICSDDVWLNGALELMQRCDGVILVPGWEKSSGTIAEIEKAKNLNIPVFENVIDIKNGKVVNSY